MITQAEIIKLVKDYIQSPEGQKEIFPIIKEKYDKSTGEGNVMKKTKVQAIVQEVEAEFIKAVQEVIKSFRPEYVKFHINPLSKDYTVSANIQVEDEGLYRESLHYIKRDLSIGHGEGVKDILALFTHGYTLTKRPYGYWVKDGGNSSVYIGALAHREPNSFLQQFVDKMNEKFAPRCHVTLDDKYKNK